VETFRAVVEAAPRGGTYVVVPAPVVAALGGKGRIPVRATFDGVPYRGSIATMGGQKVLGLLAAIRDQVGAGIGDEVTVTVEGDTAERTVEVPPDLAAALAAAGLWAAFDGLSHSHRREYVNWIEGAKQTATRARRVDQTVERVGGAGTG
jgi:hypothetical protein